MLLNNLSRQILVAAFALFVVFVSAVCLAQVSYDSPQTKKDDGINEHLWDAVSDNDSVTVRRLIEEGADVNAKANRGRTTIKNFSYSSDTGASVGSVSRTDTPMKKAISDGNVGMIRLFLSLGAKDDAERTALFSAIQKDKADIVRSLILGHTQSLDWDGKINCNSKECKEYIRKENAQGDSPIKMALKSPKLTKIMEEAGADYSKIALDTDEANDNLLSALSGGNFDGVQFALERGANANMILNQGDDLIALTYAANQRYYEIAKILIEYGADVNYASRPTSPFSKHPGFTPLIMATFTESKKIVELLIENGADINAITDTDKKFYSSEAPGVSALLAAVSKNNADLVQILIEAGADVKYKVPSGKLAGFTALSLAKDKSMKKMLKSAKKIFKAAEKEREKAASKKRK